MQKDYAAVSAQDAAADEDAFVEEYWSRRWDQVQSEPDAAAVARTEAFRIIEPFVRELAHVSRVLDGGCGTGAWTVYFDQLGFETVGLDISERTVTRLQMMLPRHRFVCGDVRRTGFPDASFDAYFSWGTFEHFEIGVGPCIEEAHRILRPGGLLMISLPFQNWRHILRQRGPLHRWEPGFDARTGFTQPHRFYQWRLTREELRRELELRGFRVRKVATLDKREGVNRWLAHDLRLARQGTRPYAALGRLLTPLVPAGFISHMQLAVAVRGSAVNSRGVAAPTS